MSDLADLRSALLAEVRAMQDDQRYGSLTCVAALGLLIAIEILDGPTNDGGTDG